MPDEQGALNHGWPGLPTSSPNAHAGLADVPASLAMVGFRSKLPRSGTSGFRWFARLKAAVKESFFRYGATPDRSSGSSVLSSKNQHVARASLGNYATGISLVAAAAVLGLIVQPYLTPSSIVLLFLVSVLFTAIAQGLGPSLVASVLSILAYDFLFLPPLYSLNVDNPDDVIRMASFGLAAVIVSNLASFARHQAVLASQRAAVAEELYRFGRQLAGSATLPEMLAASIPRIQAMVGAVVLILLPDGEELAIYRDISGRDPLPGPDLAGTDMTYVRTWSRRDAAGAPDPDPPASSHWRFVPMRTGRGKVGVMAIGRETPDALMLPHSEALFGTLADLMAQAIDRINLVETLNEASRAVEREQLQAALMASLSHDLRTPLAGVLASAESLIGKSGEPDAGTRQALTRSIQDDARRLNRYIGNLLDMTRLESGLADASKGRIDLADVVSVALERCADVLTGHNIAVTFEDDLPMLAGDEVLLEHVLFNLLDNAAKYTPPGSGIELRAFRDGDFVSIQLIDEGEGIRSADLGRIFDKFYRSQPEGARRPGIGLGLAICRGYVEAMGGHITASNRDDRRGAVFTMTLPVPAAEDMRELTV
jgi:two-component system sensor histidine kinase KdpD